jgi:hypothetical protein
MMMDGWTASWLAHLWSRAQLLPTPLQAVRCLVRRAARDGGRGVASTIIATSDVMCISRLQPRLVMAWTVLPR